MKLGKIFVAIVVIGVVLAAAIPQADAKKYSEAQRKVLAKRAAIVDGYRKLAERVKGLKIRSDTYVRDFVAESDQIETSLRTFLRGARIVGKARYYSDGLAEVDMEVTLATVIVNLKSSHKAHYKGKKYKISDFDEIKIHTKKTVIQVMGEGVAPDNLPDDVVADLTKAPITTVRPMAYLGWEDVTARGRLMAKRAATVDGYRKMGERINGLVIRSDTYVRDFVAESDEIATSLNTFIRGLRTVGRPRYMPDQICEVDVEVTLRTVIANLKSSHKAHYKGKKYKISDFDQISIKHQDKIIRVTGEGVAPEKYKKGTVEVEVEVEVNVPAWAAETITAKGSAVRPEGENNVAKAKLMAARGAKIVALRNLGERINGVSIRSGTIVRDFVTEHDSIRADLNTFISGAHVISTVHHDDGQCDVVVEIPLRRLWQLIVFIEKGN